MILTLLVDPTLAWYKITLIAFIAMAIKNFVRINNQHIFNPAAFGIFMTMILFGAFTQWKGTYFWYILLPGGIYFAKKLGKLKILISYFLVSLVLFGSQSVGQRIPLENILGYLSYFYIFVMIIEPKTSPVKPGGQLIFGAGIAVLIFMLTESGARFDVELFSLLVLNIAVLFINKVTLKTGGV